MNRIVIFLFVAFFVSGHSILAQKEPVDLEMVYKIKQEGLRNSEVMNTTFYLTDVIGPRLTGSSGMKRSYDWTVQQLKDWGLENVNLEPWGEFGKGWENEKSYVAMTVPYYQALIAIPKAWSAGTNGLVKGKPVLLDINKEEDIEQYRGQLNGKIVMVSSERDLDINYEPQARRHDEEALDKIFMNEPSERGSRYSAEDLAMYRTRRALQRKIDEFVKQENVAVILSNRRGDMGTVFTSNGSSYKADAEPGIPELEMSGEHYNRLVRLLEKEIDVELEVEIKNRFLTEDLNGYNVIAELPGSDKKLKDEVVIIGGHLDSWHGATGATDNASGVAVMMEAIRILKAIDARPKRTIRIALWSGEEQGLHGSFNYVEKHYGDRKTMELKPEHSKVSAYYNLDNGAGRIRGIYLQGNDMLRPVFEAWFEPFSDMGVSTVTSKNTGSTDHVAFDRIGIPGFQFIQDPLEYFSRTHHSNMDTYDRIDESDMRQAAVVVAAIVYHTANRAEKLPRKPRLKEKEEDNGKT